MSISLGEQVEIECPLSLSSPSVLVRSAEDGLVDEFLRVRLALLHDLQRDQGGQVLVLRQAKTK